MSSRYYKIKEMYNLNDREKWRIKNIDEDVIMCCKCLKNYKPCKDDITIKNPNFYFKICKNCRDKTKNYIKRNPNLHYSKYKMINI